MKKMFFSISVLFIPICLHAMKNVTKTTVSELSRGKKHVVGGGGNRVQGRRLVNVFIEIKKQKIQQKKQKKRLPRLAPAPPAQPIPTLYVFAQIPDYFDFEPDFEQKLIGCLQK